MKAEQLKHFKAALKRLGEDAGERCNPHQHYEELNLPDDAYVLAAAIGMSVLIPLREAAKTKALSPNDVQEMIDGFFDAAEIEETRTAMGAIVYQRKQKEVV